MRFYGLIRNKNLKDIPYYTNQDCFMRKHIQLNIPKPCHENWDQMTPVDKGRFCGSCQKQVVDFTTMSDEQLALFFKKQVLSSSKDGSVCGRFMQDQLDRSIDIPKKRIPWVKYFFQFLLPGFLMSCGARTIGKIKVNESKNEVVTKSTYSQTTGVVIMELETVVLPDTTKETTIVNNEVNDKEEFLVGDTTILTATTKGEVSKRIVYELPGPVNITGNVIDDNEQPIPYASVFIKGTTIGVAADSAGNFSLKYSGMEDSIVLISSCVGFKNTESIVRLNKREETITISLDAMNTLGEVVVVASNEIKGSLVFTGAVSVGQKINIIDTICNKIFPARQSLKLYPNPLKRGGTLTVEIDKTKTGTYLFQLAALNGQVVLNKELWMDKNDRVIKINIPSVAAGTYLVSMINKESGKRNTGKIIVE